MSWVIVLIIAVVGLCGGYEWCTSDESMLELQPLSDSGVWSTRHVYQSKRGTPGALQQLVNRVGTLQSFELSLTQGRWRWPHTNQPHRPAGLELRATFTNSSTPHAWRQLVHGLSGLFCASVNFLDLQSSEVYSQGVVSHDPNTNTYYATMSREPVCTENLTPFKKLMPHRARVGLESLLNPLKLYDSHYHSLSVFYSSNTWRQQLNVVWDVSEDHFTLKHLFGREMLKHNPLSVYSTLIRVILPNNWNLHPSPDYSKQISNDQIIHTYNVTKHSPHTISNISFRRESSSTIQPALNNTLIAHRYQTGYGLMKGGITTKIHNPNEAVVVRYLDAIPWMFRVLFHTLSIQIVNGTTTKTLRSFHPEDFVNFRVCPGVERVSPHEIDFTVVLPHDSSLLISVQFDKSFLRYTEHAPDANRGFDLSSSLVLYCGSSDCVNLESDEVNVLYTESLLISLPTPDFSMPYNVITLTSTVLALFFGSLFNVLIRRDESDEEE